jgi:hypothetical protein
MEHHRRKNIVGESMKIYLSNWPEIDVQQVRAAFREVPLEV